MSSSITDGIFSVMPRRIRSTHKEVPFAVSKSDEPGYYKLWFQIGDQTFRTKAKTKFPEMAIRRARIAIDRKLRQLQASNE
jgi:hypothetical protein